MTPVQLPAYDHAPALLADAEVAYDEILRLASLAQALSPDLPPFVRFFQRGPTEAAERAHAPGRVVFTHDARPILENGLQDTRAVDLFEALGQTLPAGLVLSLRRRLDAATQLPSAGGIVAQAFQAAHARGRVVLDSQPTHDPDVTISASPPYTPAPLAFRDDAFLADVGAAHLRRARRVGEDPAFDFVSAVNTVRQALATDATRMPVSRVRELVATVRSLDGLPGERPYEERSEQGWLAYSVLAGGKGWTKPLLASQAGSAIRPHTAFRGVSPLVAAVAANDAATVTALLEAGVSPNGFLLEVPAIFGARQSAVEQSAGNFVPLTVLGAACGSTEAVAQLVRHGADINLRNGAGRTALSVAAGQDNEAMVRSLMALGADLGVADADGQRPVDHARGAVKAILELGVVASPTVVTHRPSR